MYKSITEFEESITTLIIKGDFNTALDNIKKFVEAIFANPFSSTFIFSSPILDKICQSIGFSLSQTFEKPEQQTENANVVAYLATMLYTAGGHTAVIEDFINLQPQCKHLIIINDILNTPDREAIIQRFQYDNVELIWIPDGNLSERVVWLQKKLYELNANKIWLFNHHQDSVVIAAVQPDMPSEILYYHHGDHHLCLGVHLNFTVHVDPHNMGYFHCRQTLEVKENIYLPLACIDRGCRSPNVSFLENGVLRTCSSGSANKFEASYLYSYSDVLPQLLHVTKGIHVHIGPLSTQMLDVLYKKMYSLNIQKERFIHIPWVSSVWETLIEQKIDLYLSSFPFGGGKASIEVMGSGTPIIMHESYRSQFYGGRFMVYPEAFYWKTPQELLDVLPQYTADVLKKQSIIARSYYEAYYQPKLLQQELNKTKEEKKGITPPPLPSYQQDSMQIFLDLMPSLQAAESLEFEKHILQHKNRLLEEQNRLILNSLSWQITKPLRFLNRTIRQIKHRAYSS